MAKKKKQKTSALDKALSGIYYAHGEEGALTNTPPKLLRIALSKIKHPSLRKQLTLARIKQFLIRQSSYTVHRRLARKQFPRRRIRLTSRALRVDADLIELGDLAYWNSGHNYILVLIDAFTKYVWATPLKSKHAEKIAQAIEDILQTVDPVPSTVYTDAGKEFIGAPTQKVFKDYNITHRICGGEAFHCPFVERVNRTLKEKLFQAMTASGTRRWLDLLPPTVASYNKSVHSTTGMRPIETTDADTLTVWENTYKKDTEDKKKKYKFKVGDHVRILKEQTVFSRGFLPRFTWEIFKVAKLANDRGASSPPAYILQDLNGEIIELAVFYESELSAVDPSLVSGPNAIFPVHKVLASRVNPTTKKQEVKVWWQGWPADAAEWIPKVQLAKSI